MSRGIGPWPFVPQSCMTGANSQLYNVFEQFFKGGLLS
jgi:hypothetical protein